MCLLLCCVYPYGGVHCNGDCAEWNGKGRTTRCIPGKSHGIFFLPPFSIAAHYNIMFLFTRASLRPSSTTLACYGEGSFMICCVCWRHKKDSPRLTGGCGVVLNLAASLWSFMVICRVEGSNNKKYDEVRWFFTQMQIVRRYLLKDSGQSCRSTVTYLSIAPLNHSKVTNPFHLL